MKNFTYYLLAVIILGSCNLGSGSKSKKVADNFPKERDIKHQKMLEDAYGLPIRIQYHNNMLLITDLQSDFFCSLYDINKREIILKFLSKGQGPNETPQIPSSLSFINDSTIIWYDINRTIRKAILTNDYKHLNKIELHLDLQGHLPFYECIPIENNEYLAVGLFNGGRYAIVDNKGHIKEYKYNYIEDNINAPELIKSQAYQGKFITSPKKDKILFYTIMSEILDFMSVENSELILKNRIIGDLYKYHVQDGLAIGESNVAYFLNGTASENYVYLLYSGEELGDSFTKGSTVFVFSWEGIPIMKYNLDINVTAIAINDSDSQLYALTNTPEGTLVSFDLEK